MQMAPEVPIAPASDPLGRKPPWRAKYDFVRTLVKGVIFGAAGQPRFLRTIRLMLEKKRSAAGSRTGHRFPAKVGLAGVAVFPFINAMKDRFVRLTEKTCPK